MKDTNLTEVFCEVLGGLALAILILPLLSLTGIYKLGDIVHWLVTKVDLAVLGSILVLAFLAGVIIDAIGLAADELFLGKLVINDELSELEQQTFWKNLSEPVLEYRDRQWAWYSCYRNLFLLFLPSGLIWFWIIGRQYSWCKGFAILAIFVGVEISLFITMRTLLSLYYKISRSVNS